MEATTLTECRTLKSLLGDDWRDYAEAVEAGETDIQCGDSRMIRGDEIDEVQRDELSDDTYMLGCFTGWFIADHTPLSLDAVRRLQKAEQFEALGELMLIEIDDVQRDYVSADGYGHHFNHEDFGEEEIEIDGVLWHVFVM